MFRQLVLQVVVITNLFFLSFSVQAKDVKIAVNQYVHHPNLTEVLKGFKEVMAHWAEENKINVVYDEKNATGNVPSALQIARQQAKSGNDLILALATPSAQAAVKQKSDTPVVFAAITDPVQAGLVESLESPRTNATGSSDIGPYAKQFEMFRTLFPKAKNVGVLHNPSEVNSVVSMKIIREAAKSNDFTLNEVPVTSTNEVVSGVRAISEDADILYMPADNTVLSSLSSIVRIADSKKIPLLVGDEGSVKLGGVFTLGVNYYESGRETAKIAIRVLEGEKPGNIPVSVGRSTRMVINMSKMKELETCFPVELLPEMKDAVFVDSSS